jgi:hypothetical protein
MPTTSAVDDRTVIPAIPPLNWRREVPKYRISGETLPSPKARHRFEPPFASVSDASTWQYGERVHKAGEIIATTEWPNPGTMTALNYSARQVLAFFGSAPKSRLARSPWFDDQVRLQDGLSSDGPPKIAPPKVQPIGVQPARVWPGM